MPDVDYNGLMVEMAEIARRYSSATYYNVLVHLENGKKLAEQFDGNGRTDELAIKVMESFRNAVIEQSLSSHYDPSNKFFTPYVFDSMKKDFIRVAQEYFPNNAIEAMINTVENTNYEGPEARDDPLTFL